MVDVKRKKEITIAVFGALVTTIAVIALKATREVIPAALIAGAGSAAIAAYIILRNMAISHEKIAPTK